jgi:hypothetical protein
MKLTRSKRVAAMLADAFQEEEFFLPKVARHKPSGEASRRA